MSFNAIAILKALEVYFGYVSIPDRDFSEFQQLGFFWFYDPFIAFQSLIGILVSFNALAAQQIGALYVSIPDRDFSEFQLFLVSNLSQDTANGVSIPDRDFSEFQRIDAIDWELQNSFNP